MCVEEGSKVSLAWDEFHRYLQQLDNYGDSVSIKSIATVLLSASVFFSFGIVVFKLVFSLDPAANLFGESFINRAFLIMGATFLMSVPILSYGFIIVARWFDVGDYRKIFSNILGMMIFIAIPSLLLMLFSIPDWSKEKLFFNFLLICNVVFIGLQWVSCVSLIVLNQYRTLFQCGCLSLAIGFLGFWVFDSIKADSFLLSIICLQVLSVIFFIESIIQKMSFQWSLSFHFLVGIGAYSKQVLIVFILSFILLFSELGVNLLQWANWSFFHNSLVVALHDVSFYYVQLLSYASVFPIAVLAFVLIEQRYVSTLHCYHHALFKLSIKDIVVSRSDMLLSVSSIFTLLMKMFALNCIFFIALGIFIFPWFDLSMTWLLIFISCILKVNVLILFSSILAISLYLNMNRVAFQSVLVVGAIQLLSCFFCLKADLLFYQMVQTFNITVGFVIAGLLLRRKLLQFKHDADVSHA